MQIWGGKEKEKVDFVVVGKTEQVDSSLARAVRENNWKCVTSLFLVSWLISDKPVDTVCFPPYPPSPPPPLLSSPPLSHQRETNLHAHAQEKQEMRYFAFPRFFFNFP